MMSDCSGGGVVVPLVWAAAANDGEAEPAQFGPKDGAHCYVDEEFETRVGYAEPEDAEVEERDGVDPVAREELVEGQADKGHPAEPKGHHQNKGHEMSRVGQVLAQRRRVLFVLLQ